MPELTFDEGAHTYELDGERVVSVTKALVGGGLVDTKWFTDFARDRGSAVHKAIYLFERGDLDEETIDPRVRPFFDAYLKFRAEYRWEPEHSEVKVWSNRHKYAGTLDAIGKALGARSIVDYKTGALSPAVGVQLTGYALARAECHGQMIPKLLGVRLVGDGTYRIQGYKLDPVTFYSALNITKWKGATK